MINNNTKVAAQKCKTTGCNKKLLNYENVVEGERFNEEYCGSCACKIMQKNNIDSDEENITDDVDLCSKFW